MTDCKYPNCDREVGTEDRGDYRTRSFCSAKHEVKYDHLKEDAKDARLTAMERKR